MLNKYTENRPWGKFEQFTHNEKSTVKLLYLNPQHGVSLQYHNHRDEFWKIIAGPVKIRINDKVVLADKNDEFFIPRGALHQASATNVRRGVILEISLGDFDEKDIVRVDDPYNR